MIPPEKAEKGALQAGIDYANGEWDSSNERYDVSEKGEELLVEWVERNPDMSTVSTEVNSENEGNEVIHKETQGSPDNFKQILDN